MGSAGEGLFADAWVKRMYDDDGSLTLAGHKTVAAEDLVEFAVASAAYDRVIDPVRVAIVDDGFCERRDADFVVRMRTATRRSS